MKDVSLATLSYEKKLLVKMMNDLNYGQILNLRFKDGEPVLRPPPRLIREVVFGKDNQCNAMSDKSDYALKKQVLQLFEIMEETVNGTIVVLRIQNGLPIRMELE